MTTVLCVGSLQWVLPSLGSKENELMSWAIHFAILKVNTTSPVLCIVKKVELLKEGK